MACIEFNERRRKMTQSGEVYKCEICGNVVNVMQPGVGELVCCGESMRLLSQEEAQAY